MEDILLLTDFIFEDEIVMDDAIRYLIRDLIEQGIFDQNDIFEILYPNYEGHYARLREIIAEEKNYA